MHIALVHNKHAGSGVISGDDLVGLLRDSGYAVDLYGKDDADVLRAIQSRPRILVVSGGDGTVAKVAIAACGTDIPIYILPTGTSNNIARAVGVDAAIPMLIGRIASARLGRLDVGRISGDGHETSFVEAVGAGFMGSMLAEGQRRSVRFVSAVRGLISRGRNHWVSTAEGVAEHVRREPARRFRILADGEDLSGEYIAVEVLNIASIGPRISLAPDANVGDGLLDLVLALPTDRDALATFIESLGAGNERTPVSVRRVRVVEMDWPAADAHVDDELWPADAREAGRPSRVTVSIRGTTRLLVPDV